MPKKLLIVGGRGSGEIAMSTFESVNEVNHEWNIEGYLNDVAEPGSLMGKHKIVGSTSEIHDWVNKGYHIHYTLHFNAKAKEERVNKLINLNIPPEAFASAVHPKAYLNPETEVGLNTLLLPFSATSVGTKVGNHIHVYTSGFLGHDCHIEDFSTIAAHSIIGGRVRVKKGAHIGLNSSVREDVEIGEYSILGMGSVLLKNIESKSVYAGNPAKFIKKLA